MRCWLGLALGVAGLSGVGAACGGGGGGGQGPSVTIAKGGAPNGDGQSAVVAPALPTSLKVLVQEDGAAKAGATVAWSSTTAGAVSSAQPRVLILTASYGSGHNRVAATLAATPSFTTNETVRAVVLGLSLLLT